MIPQNPRLRFVSQAKRPFGFAGLVFARGPKRALLLRGA
jgi:hypothetical protein